MQTLNFAFYRGAGRDFSNSKTKRAHRNSCEHIASSTSVPPRQPNEHDSAKRSLDTTTNSVIRKISSKGKRILVTQQDAANEDREAPIPVTRGASSDLARTEFTGPDGCRGERESPT